MSHFAVLVIGDNVEAQLAPFHEFESTGRDDEYVIDVDVTEEKRADYEKGTASRYIDNAGKLHDPYQDHFYREPTAAELEKHGHRGKLLGIGGNGEFFYSSRDWGDGRGYRGKVHFLPEGWVETRVPYPDLFTFLEYLRDHADIAVLQHGQKRGDEHKYSFVQLDAKGEVEAVFRHTNPNDKWDYYSIGGRWAGFLKLKPGGKGTAHRRKGNFSMDLGETPAGYADVALKGDVDFEQMRNDKGVKARALWKRCREITGGQSWESWDDTLIRCKTGEDAKGEPIIDIKRAREEYADQPAIELLKASKLEEFIFEVDDNLALEEETYVQRERDGACCLFAFLRDGHWTERGQMGWFGNAHGEMSMPQWRSRFNAMLDSLPDDTLLSVVDCHI